MSSEKWTNDEELKLIKSISVGKSIEQIATDHNRSISAVDMRLKKIIYENISSGLSIDRISKLLNLPNKSLKKQLHQNSSYIFNG